LNDELVTIHGLPQTKILFYAEIFENPKPYKFKTEPAQDESKG